MQKKTVLIIVLAMALSGLTMIGAVTWGYAYFIDRPNPYLHTHYGIDVSHHQGEINWRKVPRSVKFVYVKCTEGATYQDPKYHYNVKHACRRGFDVGSYHFFRMTSGAHEQYVNFVTHSDPQYQSLVPMVDVEYADGKSPQELQDSLKVFVTLLELHYGVRPMIYCPRRLYYHLLGTDSSAISYWDNYPLYLASYKHDVPLMKDVRPYTIWQFTEKGRLSGISCRVDLGRFHPDCDVQMLRMEGSKKMKRFFSFPRLHPRGYSEPVCEKD